MPQVELMVQKWPGKIREITLGGNGRKSLKVGGANTLPFLHFEGSMPNPPRIGIEVWDREPAEWSSKLLADWGDVLKDPATWAKKAAEYGAELIYLVLASAHPEDKNSGAKEARATVTKVLEATDLPLIVIGPGVVDKDNEVLVAAAEAARGQRIALGNCVEKNYRTIVAGSIANGHLAIASTPIEMNLAKQLNILCCDVGLSPDSIIMDTTTGALGYGLEYSYSVVERLRLAALNGDGMTAMPMLVTPGFEAWRQKEAKFGEGLPKTWGEQKLRSILWESITATTLIHAGADIAVLRHPQTVELVRATINGLMKS